MRVLVVVLLMAALAGCTGKNAVDTQAASSSGFVAGDGTVQVIALGERTHVPVLRGRTLDGAQLDTGQWRGDVLVVNFWASWCGPCRAEADGLQAAYDATKASGVRFLGVNVKDDAANARAFVRSHDIGYPSLNDQPGLNALTFHVPPNAIPSTVVIDRDGREAARVSGAIRYTRLLALVRQLVREPTAAGR